MRLYITYTKLKMIHKVRGKQVGMLRAANLSSLGIDRHSRCQHVADPVTLSKHHLHFFIIHKVNMKTFKSIIYAKDPFE